MLVVLPAASAMADARMRLVNARGGDYASRYRPESFLCLSESIDLHHVNAARMCVPATIIAM